MWPPVAWDCSAFYGRRARRILPAAILVIIVTLIAERVIVGGPIVAAIAGDARWASSFLADYPRQGQSHRQAGASRGLLVAGRRGAVLRGLSGPVLDRRRARASMVTALPAGHLPDRRHHCLVHLVRDLVSWELYAYVSPLTRAWELAAGGLVAVGAASLKKLPIRVATAMTWIGLVGLLVIGRTLTIPASSGLPGWIVALPVLATALIIGGGTRVPRHGAEMLLRLAPFKWIGRWSYSIYLWHYPILVIAAQHWGNLTTLENLALCVGAVIVSAVTYFAIENPIRHSKFLADLRRPASPWGCR